MDQRTDIASVESLNDEIPDKFRVEESDSEYDITKKRLEYELYKRQS